MYSLENVFGDFQHGVGRGRTQDRCTALRVASNQSSIKMKTILWLQFNVAHEHRNAIIQTYECFSIRSILTKPDTR